MLNVGGCDRRKVATQCAFVGNHDNKDSMVFGN